MKSNLAPFGIMVLLVTGCLSIGQGTVPRDRPADAYVSVDYRNHWFWIDDRDLKSKRAFAFMEMLFTFAGPSEKENLPLLTIPTQY